MTNQQKVEAVRLAFGKMSHRERVATINDALDRVETTEQIQDFMYELQGISLVGKSAAREILFAIGLLMLEVG